MKKVKPEKLECLQCGHRWTARASVIWQCPKCRSPKFDQPKEETIIVPNKKKRFGIF